MTLKEFVVRDGEPVPGKGSRGRLLFHDEKEWLHRTHRFIIEYTREFRPIILIPAGASVAITMGVTVLTFILLGVTDWRGFLEITVLAVVVGGGLVLIFVGLVYGSMWFHTLRLRRDLPVPGLYENGLEVPAMNASRSVFMPYEELGEVKQSKDTDLKEPHLMVYSRSEKWIVTLPISFLGSEGIALLLERSSKEDEVEPPDLVLYGVKGRRA
jgi:hypothetical protein